MFSTTKWCGFQRLRTTTCGFFPGIWELQSFKGTHRVRISVPSTECTSSKTCKLLRTGRHCMGGKGGEGMAQPQTVLPLGIRANPRPGLHDPHSTNLCSQGNPRQSAPRPAGPSQHQFVLPLGIRANPRPGLHDPHSTNLCSRWESAPIRAQACSTLTATNCAPAGNPRQSAPRPA